MTTTIPTDLGGLLRYHRTRLGLSLEEVAIHVERGYKSIIDWEANERPPRLPLLVKLAGLYGVTVGELASAEVPDRRIRSRAATDAGGGDR